MIWHYTVGGNFASIYHSGAIQPATAYIEVGEKPIVWFTTEEFWEPTVTKGIRRPDGTVENLGMRELIAEGFLLWRIGVAPETAPYNWSELKKLSGMPSGIATRLAKVAKKQRGNPSKWRGTFTPVRAESWKAIEYFNRLEWVPFSPKPTESQ
jgi:hypothetical protein